MSRPALAWLAVTGDKVVTFRYGQFSHLWIDMMQRMGLAVTVIDRPWGEGADEAILQVGFRQLPRPELRLLHALLLARTRGLRSADDACRAVQRDAAMACAWF